MLQQVRGFQRVDLGSDPRQCKSFLSDLMGNHNTFANELLCQVHFEVSGQHAFLRR